MDKNKGIAALILGSKKPNEESDIEKEDSQGEGEMDEGLLSAAEDMMSAVTDKDPRAFAEALKSFMEMC